MTGLCYPLGDPVRADGLEIGPYLNWGSQTGAARLYRFHPFRETARNGRYESHTFGAATSVGEGGYGQTTIGPPSIDTRLKS